MKRLITTPIYYANGRPHIGHAATTILADVFKRSLILNGDEVFFSTGLDEHGQKNQQVVEKLLENEDVKNADEKTKKARARKYLDEIAVVFDGLFKTLKIDYDIFIRTSDEIHVNAVQKTLQKLYDEGKFFKKVEEYKYCVGCEMFKKPSDLNEQGLCPDHLKAPIDVKEENWYFDLNKHSDWLKQILEVNGFMTKHYQKELLNKTDGMPPLCISRPKEKIWHGITLPFDEKFTTYVWFDALLNYLTVIGYPESFEKNGKKDLSKGLSMPLKQNNNGDNKTTDKNEILKDKSIINEEDAKELWKGATHLMAKEITQPHLLYWPVMLKEMGINHPYKEFVHGYLLASGKQKMSKSLGNGLDAIKTAKIFGSDAVRFILSKFISHDDAELDYEIFLSNFNTDLANIIGNAFFRTYSLAKKAWNNVVPNVKFSKATLTELEEFKSKLNILPKGEDINDINIYVKNLIEVFKSINVYVDSKAPWSIADENEKNETLLTILEMLRMAFIVASPILVDASEEVLKALGAPVDFSIQLKIETTAIKAKHIMPELKPLFQRMKLDELTEKLNELI
jgi:methionyl-tRNA synthetase